KRAEILPVHAGGRSGGSVSVAVVGHVVAADADARIRLADGVAQAATGGVVVVVAGECPAISRITSGVGVSRAGQIQKRAQVFTVHAGGRPNRRVCAAVVGHVVAADADSRVGLADAVID